eukprot:COSAG01_NODE_4007_length_5440_cov_3.804531_1_plen_158_part_10
MSETALYLKRVPDQHDHHVSARDRVALRRLQNGLEPLRKRERGERPLWSRSARSRTGAIGTYSKVFELEHLVLVYEDDTQTSESGPQPLLLTGIKHWLDTRRLLRRFTIYLGPFASLTLEAPPPPPAPAARAGRGVLGGCERLRKTDVPIWDIRLCYR